MNDAQQLVKKERGGGGYRDIFPNSYTENVRDKESGEFLDVTLAKINFLFLPYHISKEHTRLQVPFSKRRRGLWISYVIPEGRLVIEYYIGDDIEDSYWQSDAYWFDTNGTIVDPDIAAAVEQIKEYVDAQTQLNPEDLERNNNNQIQFSDKEYDTSAFSGLGRVYLRKNISNGKNILTQDMVNKPNTRYIIQYDYNLNGEEITIPEGCVLDFQGGSFKNGIITKEVTIIANYNEPIFDNIVFNDIPTIPKVSVKWFGAKGDGITDDSESIINAIKCLTGNNNINISIEDIGNASASSLYFPKGIYNIEENYLFTNAISSKKGYLKIEGEHRKTSVIRLISNGVEKWLFNNDDNKYQKTIFYNISIVGDNINFCNGFKMTSTDGWSKQIWLIECSIRNINELYNTSGDHNTDLTIIQNSEIYCNTLFHLNNINSVLHRCISSTLQCYKDMIIGEAQCSLYFDKCEIDEYPDINECENKYVLNANTVFHVVFQSCRFELRNKGGLVNLKTNTSCGDVIFDNCQIANVGTIPVTEVGYNKKVLFQNTEFAINLTFAIGDASINEDTNKNLINYAHQPIIILDHCEIWGVNNIYEYIVFRGINYTFDINNTIQTRIGSIGAYKQRLLDATYGYNRQIGYNIVPKIKTTYYNSDIIYYLTTLSNEFVLELPQYALIKDIYIDFPENNVNSINSGIKWSIIGTLSDGSEEEILSISQRNNSRYLFDIRDINVNKYKSIILRRNLSYTMIDYTRIVAYINYI